MLKGMKKYSIPQTEAITMILGSTICDPSAGKGSSTDPTPSEVPQGAPTRVSVLYI